MALKLDAEPDADRFDLDVRALAPADGLLAALTGVKRPIDLTIEGAGSWTRWRGSANLLLSGRSTGTLALAADRGRYRLSGTLAPAPFLKGRLQRLTAPSHGRGRGDARGPHPRRPADACRRRRLRAVARGGVDLGASALAQGQRRASTCCARRALVDNMAGRGARMLWTLDGAFDRADYAYRLTSPSIVFDGRPASSTSAPRGAGGLGRGRCACR